MNKLVVFLAMILFLITGCSNETFNKALDQGKLALASKEYDKAIASFELALEEKKDDKEAKILQTQTTKMVQAMKAQTELKVDQAIALFEEVEKTKEGSATLQKQAKEQREALVTNKNLQDTYTKQLANAEQLKNNKKYTESKEILSKIVEETNSNEKFASQHQKASELIKQIDDTVANEEAKKVAKEKKEKEKTNADSSTVNNENDVSNIVGKLNGTWMSQEYTDRPVGMEIQLNSTMTGGEFMEHNIWGKGTSGGDFKILNVKDGIVSIQFTKMVEQSNFKAALKIENNTLNVYGDFYLPSPMKLVKE